MITKNLKLILRYPFQNTTANTGKIKLSDGTFINLYGSAGSGTIDIGDLGTENQRIIRVGNGTTQPTTSDYNLESEVSGLTINVSDSFPNSNERKIGTDENNYEVADNYGIINVSATLTNNTDTSITISEIGFFVTESWSATAECLLDREVFDPLTIEPNESYSVYIKIG